MTEQDFIKSLKEITPDISSHFTNKVDMILSRLICEEKTGKYQNDKIVNSMETDFVPVCEKQADGFTKSSSEPGTESQTAKTRFSEEVSSSRDVKE